MCRALFCLPELRSEEGKNVVAVTEHKNIVSISMWPSEPWRGESSEGVTSYNTLIVTAQLAVPQPNTAALKIALLGPRPLGTATVKICVVVGEEAAVVVLGSGVTKTTIKRDQRTRTRKGAIFKEVRAASSSQTGQRSEGEELLQRTLHNLTRERRLQHTRH
jgi:hypothetical protein